jgi:hypothetical protein
VVVAVEISATDDLRLELEPCKYDENCSERQPEFQ